MSRRIMIILLLLFNLLTLPGCWDKQEAEDLAIIVGIGIEQTADGRVQLILQTVNPPALAKSTSGGRGITFEKAYRNRVVEGDTVSDAISKFIRQVSKKRYLAHTGVILISENFARQRGVKEVLDAFERNPRIRFTPWILIGRGDLVALLDVPGQVDPAPANRIIGITDLVKSNSFCAPLRKGEFLRLMQRENTEVYTAVVELTPNPSQPQEPGYGISDGNVPEPLQEIREIGTAVFRQDKMVGFLDEKESRGLLLIKGESKGAGIQFPNPYTTEKQIYTFVVRSRTKLRPEIRDGSIYLTVEINAETRLAETQASIDLTETETIQRLESAQAEEIEAEIRSALDKGQQEYQVDVFGFGEAVHRRYPQEWKEMKTTWTDLFPAVPVEIQVKNKILSTGTTNNPPELKPE